MKKEREVQKKRIIIGISGATGILLAERVLEFLKKSGEWEIHLIITRSAERTIELEYASGIDKLRSLADVVCGADDIANSVSSGSFCTEGMIVVPCSMKTLAGIASGYSDNLLLRAADVTLKEHRKLLLAVRESPLSTIHLRNMYELSRMGCLIVPPMLSYYNNPRSVEDMTDYAASRILKAFGIETEMYHWKTPETK